MASLASVALKSFVMQIGQSDYSSWSLKCRIQTLFGAKIASRLLLFSANKHILYPRPNGLISRF